MKNKLARLQIIGFVFTGITGTLLHFLYDWTGKNPIVAIFSAVNESIWEHMKLLFVPLLIFALFESRVLKNKYPNFWCSKLAGTLLGLIIIPSLYYTYTGAFGVNADWFNITIYFIAAAAVYFAEWIFIKNRFKCLLSPTASLVALFIIGGTFIIFTFLPLHIPLFQDPVTKHFGI